MNMKKTLYLLIVFLLVATESVVGQVAVTGTVVDAETGQPLAGANVTVAGTTNGAATNLDGVFQFSVSSYPVTVNVSFIGYDNQSVEISSGAGVTIRLSPGVQLDDVVVVGSRFAPRTVIDSPVPIDNIKAADLISTGHPTFDKMLTYAVPSFNSTQQTVSDATAHFDPGELRGMGPSRTLVLINGKRKSASALVYINDTPGKGEVGVDMKSIPAAAIERVEVLRDGASANYGSDAIAGVINVILKENVGKTEVNVHSGITSQSDGFNVGYDVNTGFKLGEKGFVNVTHSFYDVQETNRAGTPGSDNLFGVDASNPFIQAHPDLGMRIGTPNMTTSDVFFNGSMPVSDAVDFYSFGGLTLRKGTSYALYRTPYWVPDPHNLLHEAGTTYEGFHPTFETNITDNTFAVGFRGVSNGWNFDLSNSSGSNDVEYIVNNSLNPAMGADSPIHFNTGGYAFSNNVTNLDISRRISNVTISAGTEFRRENFEARAGDEASYIGAGVQSFPGLQPQNEVDEDRNNVGVYADLGLDASPEFFVGGAVRYENYSDFGNNVTWKLESRYKIWGDRGSIRGSVSTGFRAPSLHQIFLSNIQTLVSGGTVSNQGTFNNQSPVLRSLNVRPLKEEEATNITAGIALRPVDGLYVSVDLYQIDVNDRIVYSSSISSTDQSTLVGQLLNQFSITSLKFFANAVDTQTQGIDLVANYKWDAGGATYSVNLGANISSTEIQGNVNTPAPIAAAGVDLFDRKEQSRLTSARPGDKVILGLAYERGSWKATINNTKFGEVKWQHGSDPSKDQVFSSKVLTDVNVEYTVNDKVTLGISANNLFDVFPDEIDTKGDVVTDLGGRFRYPWEVNQFGFNGTTFSGNLKLTL